MNFAEYTLRESYLTAIHEHNLKLLKLEHFTSQPTPSDELQAKLFEIEKQSKMFDVMKAKIEIDKLELELQKYKKE